MKKPPKPKNVLQFKSPEKSVRADLPSVEWLKELQETLKKQSEAAIALVKLTTDAAQQIHRYTERVISVMELFTDAERIAGYVSWGRGIKIITGLQRPDRAKPAFQWLMEQVCTERGDAVPDRTWSKSFLAGVEVGTFLAPDPEEIHGYYAEDGDYDSFTIDAVLGWRQNYRKRAKKDFDAIDGQTPPKAAKKRGRKRQVPARGKRYQSKSAE
jgi:hypothetical protein